MIYGLFRTIEDDGRLLTRWVNGKVFNGPQVNESSQKIQDAALRMLAVSAMLFSGLWLLKIMTFLVTVPFGILFKLSVAISIYALSHDVFIMIQNHAQEAQKGIAQGVYEGALRYLRGMNAQPEDQARQFTHGTYLQPVWMYLYVNRNIIARPPAPVPAAAGHPVLAAGKVIGQAAVDMVDAVAQRVVGDNKDE